MTRTCLSRTLVSLALVLAPLALAAGCASTDRTAASPGALRDQVTFTIDGMACPNCAKHIEEELREIPGVRAAKVDFATKTATVSLDPDKPASMQSLEAAVAQWKKEHFAQEEDPDCLDPANRAAIKAAESGR